MKTKILILAVLLAVGFAGCKASDDKKIKDLSRPAQSEEASLGEEATNDSLTNADGKLGGIRDEILDKCKIEDSLPLETDALERLYGIDVSMVKDSAGFVTMSGTFPHEVIMIEATDASSADAIAGILENRLSEVKNQSKSYDAKNYALALECKVVKNGNYISLFLSPDHKEITEVYNEYIK